jgi:hypothetical protein
MIFRIVECDICGTTLTEVAPGTGFPHWGQLQGVNLDGSENPFLCPAHLAKIADFADKLRQNNLNKGNDYGLE